MSDVTRDERCNKNNKRLKNEFLTASDIQPVVRRKSIHITTDIDVRGFDQDSTTKFESGVANRDSLAGILI
jgi:hypothetical protein